MSTNQHKILVVDDEETLRYAYRRQLESEGLSVVTAGSGDECREVFRRERAGLRKQAQPMREVKGGATPAPSLDAILEVAGALLHFTIEGKRPSPEHHRRGPR